MGSVINLRKLCRRGLSILVWFGVLGCASVPKEVVELSYLIGQDLAQLQQSYDSLVHQRFEDFRARRIDYFENVWTPEFIGEWMVDGRLIDTAKGIVVYDEALDDFVAPTPGREQQQLRATINEWSQAAIAEIDDKRKSLTGPLDAQEQEIR